MSSGVPANADMVILSRTASPGPGSSSVDEAEARRAVRDQRAGVRRALLALPDLGLAQLIDAGELGGHEVMAREDRAHGPLARGGQESQDVGEHPVAVGDLSEDRGLHVVDDERERGGVEGVLQRLGDIEPVEAVSVDTRVRGPSMAALWHLIVCRDSSGPHAGHGSRFVPAAGSYGVELREGRSFFRRCRVDVIGQTRQS